MTADRAADATGSWEDAPRRPAASAAPVLIGAGFELRFTMLWRVPDAMARITRMLTAEPAGGPLATFLPGVNGRGADKKLRCRAAVASTFLAGLELARQGTLAVQQDQPWGRIELRPAGSFGSIRYGSQSARLCTSAGQRRNATGGSVSSV